MDYYSNQMSKLIEELSCLPGIGAKSAARLAFHLIHMPVDDVKRLASTMVEARENIKYCKECYTLTDQELCPICSNSNRDHQTIIRETKKTAILITHDLAEAISTADRVLILSARPGQVKAEISLTFAPQYDSPLKRRNAPEFTGYFQNVWRALSSR